MADPTDGRHRIGAVAKMTGITTHTLRIWGRRYGLTPARSPGGLRLFSDADVERLRLVRRLTDLGHGVREVIGLGVAELEKTLRLHRAARGERDLTLERQRLLAAATSIDLPTLDAAFADLSREPDTIAVLRDVVAPILEDVCQRWDGGELKSIVERSLTSRIDALLRTLTRGMFTSGRPTLVVATPPEERHEFGALLIVAIGAIRGWNAVYFGSRLSAEEVALGLRTLGASAAAISIVTEDPTVRPFLRDLCALAPSNTHLIISGRASEKYQSKLPRLRPARDTSELASELEAKGGRDIAHAPEPDGVDCPL
jgi:MerR family transcriptional regulator, light-induced transcriptional regulator